MLKIFNIPDRGRRCALSPDRTTPHPVAIPCPDCNTALDIHQPDPQRPSLILATCQCAAWFQVSQSGKLYRIEAVLQSH